MRQNKKNRVIIEMQPKRAPLRSDPTEVVAERRKITRRTRVLIAVLVALLLLAMASAIYLFSQGGLVIIEHTRYGENFPEGLPMDQIIYHYDD